MPLGAEKDFHSTDIRYAAEGPRGLGAVLEPTSRRPSIYASLQLPRGALSDIFATADAAAIILSSVVGAGGYQSLITRVPWNWNLHVGAGIAAALLYLLIGRSGGFYQPESIFAARRNTGTIVCNWLLTTLLLAGLAFLLRIGIDFSRGSILCFMVLALPALTASRNLMKTALASAVRNNRLQGRRVVVVGLRDELATIGERYLLQRFGLSEVARIELPDAGRWSLAANKAILGSLDDALSTARDRRAEELVLALSWADPRSIDLVREKLRSSPLPVQLLPDHRVRHLVGNPAFSVNRSFSVEIQRAPLSRLERFGKRLLDIMIASFALALLSPLMLITAMAIRLDSPGPAVFRQRRAGFNAELFTIFKFRTMSVMEDGSAVKQAGRADSRVTSIGRILRASSIDELPQLFNVLRGDMSLVGPRPHALVHDDQYGAILADYAFRHHVKPGITGWAQIHGYRGGTAEVGLMRKRLEHDLWYISNWSLLLDLVIMIRTVVEVFRHRNAY